MGNIRDGAYGLTLLCPIKNGGDAHQSFACLTRQHLQTLQQHEASPLAKVPNTYMARLYILNDVFYEGSPAHEDHLRSKYLVFSSNFHGELRPYLSGFWQHASDAAQAIWRHCVGFEKVNSAASFIAYIEQCQVKTSLYFNGSSGAPLAEQLKALYLKQEFTRFVIEHQHQDPTALKAAFDRFVQETQPTNLEAPSWRPGQNSI